MQGRAPGSGLSFFLLSVLGGCQGSIRDAVPEPWLEFEWPEADSVFQGDSSWLGGDGAYSIDLGNGRVLWTFGDSWLDQEGRGRRDQARMVSNAIALQVGYDPSQAKIDFYWGTRPDGGAGAFFPDFDGGRYWPGHGVRLGDQLLLFLMEVHPSDVGLGFEISGWTAVLVANPDEEPPDWRMEWLPTPSNPAQIIIGSAGVLSHGNHVYAFGSQEPGPGQKTFLVRWIRESVLEGRIGEMEWWAGEEHGWVEDSAPGLDPIPVFTDAPTEFTVHRDDESGAFVQFQTAGFGAAVVIRRTSPELTGPWSPPDTVFIPPQVSFPRIMIYQGKAHPYLGGADLVITYCTNSFEFSNHMTEHWLYFPRFVRLSDR